MTHVTPENDYRRILDRLGTEIDALTSLYGEVSEMAGFIRQPAENVRGGWKVRWEGQWRRVTMTGRAAAGCIEIVFDPEGDPEAPITVVFDYDDILDVSLDTADLEPF